MRPAVFVFIGLVFLVHGAQCREICYIDDSPLFLYKTINWWYDCPPEQCNLLCGRPVRCTSDGHALVDYDAPGRKIELGIRGGFAEMLLAFKACRHCDGPTHFQASRLDQKYFKGAQAAVVVNDTSTIKGVTFNNMGKAQARRLQDIAPDLQFVLEGVIGGLANGRIALHGSGSLLKKCQPDSDGRDEKYPIVLKINNASTEETLARFDMVWAPAGKGKMNHGNYNRVSPGRPGP